MALQIEIPTNYAVTASYWRLSELQINYVERFTHIVLVGYTNYQARLSGAIPISERTFDLSEDTFPFVEDEPQNEREIAYTIIKSNPGEFAEALDV